MLIIRHLENPLFVKTPFLSFPLSVQFSLMFYRHFKNISAIFSWGGGRGGGVGFSPEGRRYQEMSAEGSEPQDTQPKQ